VRVLAGVYLVLTLGISFAIIRALVECWKTYGKDQRCFLIGFLVMLTGMTQRSFSQVMGQDSFQLAKSGIIMSGLAVIMYGILRYHRFNHDSDEVQIVVDKSSYENLLDILAKSQENRKLDHNTESTVDNGFDERHSSW
jgi:hypothetical protein